MKTLINFFKGRKISFWLGFVAVLVGMVALIAYAAYAAKNSVNVAVLITLLLAIVAQGVQLFLNTEELPVLTAILFGAAAGCFIYEVYGTFVDYAFKVNFFGDVSQLGNVMAVLVISGIAAIVAVVECFFSVGKIKKPAKGQPFEEK